MRGEWPDYLTTFGLGAEHVPELIRMTSDSALNRGTGGDVWASTHAWRALGQLRAVDAVAD